MTSCKPQIIGTSPSIRDRRFSPLWIVAAAGISLYIIASRSLTAGLDHDENQFVAGGALVARHGLLPYRDFPFFHTPYLLFINAVFFRLMGESAKLLLTARLISAACSLMTVLLIGFAIRDVFAWRSEKVQRGAICAGLLLFISNPMFAAVTGRAWNHDAAQVLLVAACVVFLRAIRLVSYRPLPMLAVGLLLGSSIGIRLTAAPAVLPFVGWALSDRRIPRSGRLAIGAIMVIGLIVALAPCGWIFLQSPRGFLFGNFVYPQLNTAWRMAEGSMLSTTPIGKIAYFFSRIVFSSGCAFLLVLVGFSIWLKRHIFVAQASRSSSRKEDHSRDACATEFPLPDHREESRFLALLILFLLVGSFAPAPLFLVYFYAPIPFVVLWLAFAWRNLLDRDLTPTPAKVVAIVLFVSCVACGIPGYRGLANALHRNQWLPLQVHASGIALRTQLESAAAPPGPVLTLAPIIPMEGGLDIYEQFATGPFALRIAPMVPAAERQRLHLVDSSDLPLLLLRRTPKAVLVGVDKPREEAPMMDAVPRNCWIARPRRSGFALTRSSNAPAAH